MIRLVILLSVISSISSAVINIDRYTLDCNKQFNNWSTTYTHNERRNAVVNLTIDLSQPLTRMLVYVKVNLAQNEHDHEYKWEFLRTAFSVDKMYKEPSKNFLVAAFIENLKKFMQFEAKFPLKPVSVDNNVFTSF